MKETYFINRLFRAIFFAITLFSQALFSAQPSWAEDGPFVIFKPKQNCLEFMGMCDASAAEAIGSSRFIVASDEDNVLRVYSYTAPGKPVYSFDLSAFLRPGSKHPEADIEAAARIGDLIYWITSHDTNKKGRYRKSRHRFFATSIVEKDGKPTLEPAGIPYENLLKDLVMAPQLRKFHLDRAAKKPHQQKGALNIEGLCATPQGALLIAFRNPIPQKNALLVPLENPAEVIYGKPARFGDPILLSMGGMGVRGMAYWKARKTYVMIAGHHDDESGFGLFEWSGKTLEKPCLLKTRDFGGLQPEAMVIFPEKEGQILVISDDGSKITDGGKCKDLPPLDRRFRAVWVTF